MRGARGRADDVPAAPSRRPDTAERGSCPHIPQAENKVAAARYRQPPLATTTGGNSELFVEADGACYGDLVGRYAALEEVGEFLDVLEFHEGQRVGGAVHGV